MSAIAHITEDHNEVLEHIYRGIGSKILPFSGLCLLHFDSHPDLLIPQNIIADEVFNKSELYTSISIENWIMPALYAGHISSVIWIKKPWATQIEDDTYQFYVGKNPETELISCSCTEPYFVSELLYCPPETLEGKKQISLHVLTWDTVQYGTKDVENVDAENPETKRKTTFSEEKIESIVKKMASWLNGQSIVLDIDLDFFSTTNPFVDLYCKEQLDTLSELYHYVECESPEKSVLKRSEQLSFLKSAMETVYVELDGKGCSSSALSKDMETDARKLKIRRFLEIEKTARGEVDVELIHEHGCTFDTSGLPHHISDHEEIDCYLSEFTEIFSRLKSKLKFITIARSSDDDYCPKHQVDWIQEQTLNVIQKLFGQMDVKKHYLDNK